MIKVNCLDNISDKGLSLLTANYKAVKEDNNSELVLVRSAKMHDYEINDKLLAVARAGSGVNNIPLDKMGEAGVVVFNTPGANSNAVKELTIAGMFMASRDLIGGYQWVDNNKADEDLLKSIEKAKKAFGGNEIFGKTLLVLGLGAIGGKVANAAISLGMRVIGFVPVLREERRKVLDPRVEVVNDPFEAYHLADFISVNLPLGESTKHYINKDVFNKCKEGLVLLNFSRDQLVKDEDLKVAIEKGIVRKYVTDFPNHYVANLDNVIYYPHLGASTEESEENCASMAVEQLMAYVENGEIINSVNYPNVTLEPLKAQSRLLILGHSNPELAKAIDLVLNTVSPAITDRISQIYNQFGYYVFDLNMEVSEKILSNLNNVDGVYKTRVITK